MKCGIGEYVHGYSEREAVRLTDQATTLATLLHHDTGYPQGSLVLEAGSGVGAQTSTLATQSPGAHIVSFDISASSLAAARARFHGTDPAAPDFVRGNLFRLPFPPATFDHVFLCFVLEHLADPPGALASFREVLRPGGSITVIEGDHGSAFFSPRSTEADEAIRCLVTLQAEMGGNALIGRELYPLLNRAGFDRVAVSPRLVYSDASRPHYAEGFVKRTFTAMVEGVGDQAVGRGLMRSEEWNKGIGDLYRTAGPDGAFCYLFFKATAIKP